MSNNFKDKGRVRSKLGLSSGTSKVYAAENFEKPKHKGKEGIDAMLQAMPAYYSHLLIKTKGGEYIYGRVDQSDRFTITLKDAFETLDEDIDDLDLHKRLTDDITPMVVVYKSDISYFTTRVLRPVDGYEPQHYFDVPELEDSDSE
jgi:small nuclear ribonucleoprotein (snRNP)-like protein